MSNDTDKTSEIVYGQRSDDLILIPRAKAEELAAVRDALETARTWRDFQTQVPAHIYEDVMERLTDALEDDGQNETALPKPDDTFDGGIIPGYEDGDWPEWPAQAMLV